MQNFSLLAHNHSKTRRRQFSACFDQIITRICLKRKRFAHETFTVRQSTDLFMKSISLTKYSWLNWWISRNQRISLFTVASDGRQHAFVVYILTALIASHKCSFVCNAWPHQILSYHKNTRHHETLININAREHMLVNINARHHAMPAKWKVKLRCCAVVTAVLVPKLMTWRVCLLFCCGGWVYATAGSISDD